MGVFAGERLLAHARVSSYQQFWGGRPMPMGGVADVVVAPKSVAAHDFSPTVTGAATILLEDPLLPHNTGSWSLQVSGGSAELTSVEGADSGLRLGPNGFAVLYAGTAVHILRTAGLASGCGSAEDELLDAAFAGRPAYLLEYF
jgi:predicted acetyltransferase